MQKIKFRIPDTELRIETTRSGGPGGQNVNKVASKVQLRFCVGASNVFSEEQKVQLRSTFGSRLNAEDEIMIDVDEERSQIQNRAIAIQRLHELVSAALQPTRIRRPTRPTFTAQERRLTEKKIIGERKRARRSIIIEN